MTILPRFTDAAHLAEAFERCAPGGRVVYATGPWTLDAPGNATLAMVETLRRQGRASGVARGKDTREEGRFFHYLYRAAQDRVRERASSRLADLPDFEMRDEGRVFALIEDAAARGEACPSNEAIAEQLELKDRYRAAYCFKRLVQDGLLRVVEPARYGPRVVEVCATGKRTLSVSARGGGTDRTNVRPAASMPPDRVSPDRSGEKA